MLWIRTQSAITQDLTFTHDTCARTPILLELYCQFVIVSTGEKLSTAITTYVSIFALFFGEYDSVHCALQQSIGPELHQVADIDKDWRKWVTISTGRPDRHT